MCDLETCSYASVSAALPDLSGVRKVQGHAVASAKYTEQAGTDGEDVYVRVYIVFANGGTAHAWYLLEDLPLLVRDGK